MQLPPNFGQIVPHVIDTANELIRTLEGYSGRGTVTPDAIDDRGPKAVTVREALTALRDRIDAFLGDESWRTL